MPGYPVPPMLNRITTQTRLGYSILVEAGRRYGADRVSRMSAAVAYRTIFALTPLMLIAVWVFGLVVGDSATAQEEILQRIAGFGGDELADAVKIMVETAVTGGDVAAVVGFALLLWTSSSLFLEVQSDLNDIFGAPSQYLSGFLGFARQRGLGFLWTLGLGVLLIAVWAINLIWGLFEDLFDRRGLELAHDLIGRLAPLVSLIVLPFLFAMIFQSLTRARVPRRALYVGSMFTSVAFLVAAYGIGLYFRWDSDTTASRVAGAFFVILLAAFVLSSVFLFGAQVTRTYEDYLERGRVVTAGVTEPESVISQPEPAMPVAAVLGFLGGLLVGWRRRR